MVDYEAHQYRMNNKKPPGNNRNKFVNTSGSNVIKIADPYTDDVVDNLFVAPEFNESFPQYEQTEILTKSPEQLQAVEDAIRALLDAFNVNWQDPNYTDTSKRVAHAYLDFWASGYGLDPIDEVTVFPNTGSTDDMVVVKDMRFYSLCSHHLAPIEGYGAIAYIPNKNLLGLSKLGRILDIYARRFQLQERIGQQTADALMELIKPKGVMVVLYNVTHGCMSSRGVKLHEANTTTLTSRGVFKNDPERRQEALTLMGLKTV
jgi:GTP cyclohydrolase I